MPLDQPTNNARLTNTDSQTQAAGRGGYDIGYQSSPCFWGREPGSLVRASLSLLPNPAGLRVLDAGCGEGKNAAFFAERGAKVDAIDISPLALENARRAWPELCSRMRLSCLDVHALATEERVYDVVIIYGLLHCLEDRVARHRVVEKLKAVTCPGGLHIVCALGSRLDGFAEGHIDFRPTLASHESYVDLYRDWTISHESDRDLVETHPPNYVEHRHAVTRFFAISPR
jgi:tellurite methyltransferase